MNFYNIQSRPTPTLYERSLGTPPPESFLIALESDISDTIELEDNSGSIALE